MEPILAWAFLSIVVERIIEIIVRLFPILDDIKIKELDIKLGIAFIFGLVLAFGAQLEFFSMFNIEFHYLYVGQIISAIFIMAGSNYIHDLISALNRSREQQIARQQYEYFMELDE